MTEDITISFKNQTYFGIALDTTLCDEVCQ